MTLRLFNPCATGIWHSFTLSTLRPLLLICLLAGFAAPLQARQEAKKLDVAFEKTSLPDMFRALEKQSGYVFNYFADEIDPTHTITLSMKQATVLQVLKAALAGKPYSYQVDGTAIIIRRKRNPPPPAKGSLTGVLVDEKNGDPIAGASVTTGKQGTLTDMNGRYQLDLAAGDHVLQISSVGFMPKKISELRIHAGKVTTLDITLAPARGTLQGVEVVGSARTESVAALYAKQRNNAALSDGISAEQIRRTPDNNLAQVLKRISGLTVQDNKFAVVRGMSERYNNVLLNGSSLPSTEPNRRNFSFDIIPSNLIDQVIVNKTATPDMPGEFTGGLVQINTLDIPAQPFLQLSAGAGMNSQSTGKDFYSTERLNSDYAGAAGKARQWLNRKWDPRAYFSALEKNDMTRMSEMNARIPNFYGLRRYTAAPMQQYQLSFGASKKAGMGKTIGLVMAATYRHEETIETYDAWFRQSPTIVNDAREYQFTTTIGAIGNLAYQTPKTKLVWRNVFNSRFNHDMILQDAENKSANGVEREYISIPEAGNLYQSRLEVKHLLAGNPAKLQVDVNWFADMAFVNKEQPDTRYSVGFIDGKDELSGKERIRYYYSRPVGATIREGGLFAFDLNEKKQNAGGDIIFTRKMAGLAQKIKAGYWGTFRSADYQQVSLAPAARDVFNNPERQRAVDSIGYGKPDYEIYKPENFAAGLLWYMPVSADGNNAADTYEGKQKLHAAYLMADMQPVKKLRVIGGMRMESNWMNVRTLVRLQVPGGISVTDSNVIYRETDWLPSLNIVYSLTPKFNIRAAYSKTLARPDFRERARFIYYDLRMRQNVKGVDALDYSRAKNYDLRAEWYPGPAEVIAVTAFYKQYDKPVESVSVIYPDMKYGIFYFNLESAVNRGLELDYRRSFAFIDKRSSFLKNLVFSANFTYMHSEVVYDEGRLSKAKQGLPLDGLDSTRANRKRPLQGLSPYIINAGLSYQHQYFGASITYNRFGRRVVFAGMDDHDDTYENPRDLLDLQLNARFLDQKLEIRFNISDLLNQYHIEYFNKLPDNNPPSSVSNTNNDQDPKGLGYNPESDWKLKRTRKGTNYSFTVSYRF